MIIPEYNAEVENEIIGEYPPIKGLEIFGADFFPATPQKRRPISPRENYHRMMEGKQALWMPETGWTLCDMQQFRPRQHPDNLANHQGIDGGGKIDYLELGTEITAWFGIPMCWEPTAGGCMPRPGWIAFDDMNEWESLPWPNLDAFDWDAIAEMNKEYMGTDKANQLGVQFGFWERMMCLMGVSDAAMALLDEDQEDAIHAFLDKLADTYIDYITRVSKIVHLDSVFFHDDWGTQNGPFFSLETCVKFFVQPMKKVADACHAMGIVFEHHCCGKAQDLVPAMLMTGSDYWCPQTPINDIDMLLEKYKDEKFTFAVMNPVLPKGATDKEIDELGKAFVGKYWKYNTLFTKNADHYKNPAHDQGLYPKFQAAVYKWSRMAHAGEEVQD